MSDVTEEVVKIVIPSYMRAERVSTMQYVANCSICVPESEVEAYKKHNPGVEIIAHPDSIKGISPKRQWIYEQFPNVFMVDDDITGIARMMMPGKYDMTDEMLEVDERNLTPEQVYEIIQSVAFTAKEMGAKLFGFTSAVNPRDVRPIS